jgi:sugar lactone lactonase YvrE
MAIMALLFAATETLAAATWLSSLSVDVPTRIALDAQGNIYVTEARGKNLLRVFDRKGKLLRTLTGLKSPVGVAVDGQGRIYVANQGAGSVDVYNSDFTPAFSLGAGKNEFKKPVSVTVGSNGMIYVSDAKDNRVKAYNPNGAFAFSFGGWGKGGNGKFDQPWSLAIDESKSELYVTDFGIYTDVPGVQVFDLQGNFKRSFGTYGSGVGKITGLSDLAMDKDGRVYAADSFQGVIHVLDGYGNSLETIYDPAHPTKIAIGLAVGKDNRVFIATSNKKDVDVFGMTGYTTLDASPLSLAFTAAQGAAVPAPQTVTVNNSGSGTLEWTAAKDKTWITLAPAGNAALNVGISAAGLETGTYSGQATITAATGAVETIAVQLTVTPPPAALTITPAAMTFKAQQNGPAPAPQTIDIRNLGGGTLTWTATTSQPWLSLSALTGAAPSQVLATVNTALSVGTYTDTITLTAPGAQGSPAPIAVTVTVSDTGTAAITTNLSQAKFTVTGPAPAETAQTGGGTLWKNEELVPGDYTVAFDHTPGYKKPAPRTFTVTTGKETAITAEYVKKEAKTHIVAVTGGPLNKKVTVMTLAGEQVSSFKPFAHPAADVQALAADLDASGVEKIVVTDGIRHIKVYSVDGTEQAAAGLPKWQTNAVIAAGDIDNDGKAEIILGSLIKRLYRKDMRQVRMYAFASGKLESKGLLYTEEKEGRFSLAAGDVDGDLKPEVVIADTRGVRAFFTEGGALSRLWTVQGTFAAVPEISTGDLDDDGADEIVLSEPGAIHILKGTGEPTGALISTPRNRLNPEAASVACGDVDGDGADDIAVGSVAGQAAAVVRMYQGDGTALGGPIEVKNAAGSKVNVGLGRL